MIRCAICVRNDVPIGGIVDNTMKCCASCFAIVCEIRAKIRDVPPPLPVVPRDANGSEVDANPPLYGGV